jgi:hypothetical protein
MRKTPVLTIALAIAFSLGACAGQPAAGKKAEGGATAQRADADSGGVTQGQIEENIIGTWMVADKDGRPALTNDKTVYTFVSTDKAYRSASIFNHPGEWPEMWDLNQAFVVDVIGNKVTLKSLLDMGTTTVIEFTIHSIDADEFTADHSFVMKTGGKEVFTSEAPFRYVRVDTDYGKDFLGTWEGRCTSEGSVFDDGQEHRWEFRDDGTYVYYVKDGDAWVTADAAEGDYFVAGNLFCSRWFVGETENREWWEISIDGDKMDWYALRDDESGKTYTATFEMKKVAE